MQLGRFECKDCIDETIVKSCSENGLELISKGEKRYWLFKLPCNHTKEIRTDHAIADSWSCDTCDYSYSVKPSFIYLYKFSVGNFEWLKFGFSRDLNTRKLNYKLPKGYKSVLLVNMPVETGYEAMRIEKSVHKELKSLRLCKKEMTKYMQSNGHTECYPVSALDALLEELKNYKHHDK